MKEVHLSPSKCFGWCIDTDENKLRLSDGFVNVCREEQILTPTFLDNFIKLWLKEKETHEQIKEKSETNYGEFLTKRKRKVNQISFSLL